MSKEIDDLDGLGEILKKSIRLDRWLLSGVIRGLYGYQLRNIMRYYPPEQIFVYPSEPMYEDPKPLLKRLEDYLDLEDYHWKPVLEDPKI